MATFGQYLQYDSNVKITSVYDAFSLDDCRMQELYMRLVLSIAPVNPMAGPQLGFGEWTVLNDRGNRLRISSRNEIVSDELL